MAAVTIVACATTAFAGSKESETRQTASAVLDQGGNELEVTVSLGGTRFGDLSAEFARGAVYLYRGEAADDDLLAMGITLDHDVYDEYVEDSEKSNGVVKNDDGITYVDESGEFVRLLEDGEARFMITTSDKKAFDLFEIEAERAASAFVSSNIFSDEELGAAMGVILSKFFEWDGCELEDLKFAGDEFSTGAELEKINKDDEKYVAVAKFLMDFHSPADKNDAKKSSLDPDAEYADYEWTLGLTDDGEWEVVDMGY